MRNKNSRSRRHLPGLARLREESTGAHARAACAEYMVQQPPLPNSRLKFCRAATLRRSRAIVKRMVRRRCDGDYLFNIIKVLSLARHKCARQCIF